MALDTATQALWDRLAPEFASAADAEDWITDAQAEMVASGNWGNVYLKASVLLAAHMKAMASRPSSVGVAGGGGGSVSSIKAGGTSVSFGGLAGAGSVSVGDGALLQTTYGQQFLRLRDSRAGSGLGLVLP